MTKHSDSAIEFVLVSIETYPPGSTTCAKRLECLKNAHQKLPGNVRRHMRDFNHIYAELHKALQNPDNLRSSGDEVKIENKMERLFKEGPGFFTKAYRASINCDYHPSSKKVKNGSVHEKSSAQRPKEKRNAPTQHTADHDIPAGKRPKLTSTRQTRESFESKHASAFNTGAGHPTQMVRTSHTPPPTHSPSGACIQQHTADINLTDRFAAIHEMVQELSLHFFTHQERTRMAQLTTLPTHDLEMMYIAAFGTAEWKSAAVRLQSNRALPAHEFLQCIVWSFLKLNIFDLPGPISEFGNIWGESVSDAFVRPVFETNELDYDGILRDAITRRVGGAEFIKTVTDPRSSTLAHKLLRVLETHLPQYRQKYTAASLTRLSRVICRDSIQVRGRFEAVGQEFFIKWYSNGVRQSFAEAGMQCLAPRLWKRSQEGEALVWKQ